VISTLNQVQVELFTPMWVHIVFNEKNNGILITDFAVTNNKVIMSILFPYKNIHKCN